MVQKCCVKSCKEMKRRGSKLGFFSFPKAEEMRRKWLAAVDRPETDLIRNKDLRVCSNHFCSSDYVFGGLKRKLKRAAVPIIQNENTDENNKKVVPLSSGEVRQENFSLRRLIKIQTMKLKQLQLQLSVLQKEAKYLEQESRSEGIKQAVFSIQKFMHDDNKILHYTGFEKFTIMSAVYELILPSMNEITSDEHADGSKESSISLENQFFVTMIWLRRGLDYETLGDLFGISKDTTEKICRRWIDAMYSRLDSSSIWPHRNVLIKNAPVKFREQYKNFIGRIDCIEFHIEKPSLVDEGKRSETSTTLKSLLVTDPNGAILYMSRLFPGSISDKDIIVQSGFLDVLKSKLYYNELYPGDIILAEEGFNVSSLFKGIDSDINVLTSRIGDLRFTEAELRWIRQVSRERIHLEKAIGRLKQYRVLTAEVPVSLLDSIEQIYTVCCILTNFREESS